MIKICEVFSEIIQSSQSQKPTLIKPQTGNTISNYKKILYRSRTTEHNCKVSPKQWRDVVLLMVVPSAFSDAFCPRARLIIIHTWERKREEEKRKRERKYVSQRRYKINVESQEYSIVANTSTELGRQAWRCTVEKIRPKYYFSCIARCKNLDF